MDSPIVTFGKKMMIINEMDQINKKDIFSRINFSLTETSSIKPWDIIGHDTVILSSAVIAASPSFWYCTVSER